METLPIRPVARQKDLIVEKLASESVVYDQKRHRMHCLNGSTSLIWQACDGQTTIEDIAARLPTVGLPADVDIVKRALQDLDLAHLLVSRPAFLESGLPSRRSLVHKLGLAAGLAATLLPAITTAVAPTPAMALSDDTHGDGKPIDVKPGYVKPDDQKPDDQKSDNQKPDKKVKKDNG